MNRAEIIITGLGRFLPYSLGQIPLRMTQAASFIMGLGRFLPYSLVVPEMD